jgi:phage FluMu gp28-like protein
MTDPSDFIANILTDPVIFCQVSGILQPHYYQKDILRCALTDKQVIVNTSRQVGKTTTCAALALWWALCKPLLPLHLGGQKAHTISLVAPTDILVRKLFRPLYTMVKRNPFILKQVARMTQRVIEFNDGTITQCFTSGESGGQLRGSANDLVIFDEAAHVAPQNEKEIFYEALFPSLAATGGSIYLISTPKGRANLFASLVQDCKGEEELGWKYIEVSCWDAVKAIKPDGQPQLQPEYLRQQKIQIGNLSFAQEYECELIDIGLSFFDWELIQSCTINMKDNINEYSLKLPNSEIFFGFDVARSKDKTVIVVAERYFEAPNQMLKEYENSRMSDEDKKISQQLPKILIRYVHVIDEPLSFFSGKGTTQEDILRTLYMTWRPKRIYMDATGIGIGMFEFLVKQGYPVDGITFTQKVKMELFDSLRNLMRTGRIAFSKYNNAMHEQLNGITIEQTQAGTDVLRHTTDFDDIACAMALVAECTRGYSTGTGVKFARSQFTRRLPQGSQWRNYPLNTKDVINFDKR